jgi:hypothetical protein
VSRSLLEAVARVPRVAVEGEFQRHVSPRLRELVGSSSGGRWSPPRAFPVLYLGRPSDSVIVEAYRHLVENVMDLEMPARAVGPRRLLVCQVHVSNVLDLRDPRTWSGLGLSLDDLTSPVGVYEPCQAIGRAAHQLELHGILAPAATGLGETLSLFERHLPPSEIPILIRDVLWDRLPADPRKLHAVDPSDGGPAVSEDADL